MARAERRKRVIVPERWPEMPVPRLEETDARLTQAIGAINVIHPSEFSERQQQMAYYAAQGMTDGQTARALFLTENSVKIHYKRAYNDLEVRGRTYLAYTGLDSGWIPYVRVPEEESEPIRRSVTAIQSLCLKGVLLGLTNDEIARELFLGKATVKTHLTRLQLGSKVRGGQVRRTYELGMCAPSVSPLDVILSKNPSRSNPENVELTDYRTEVVMTETGKETRIRKAQVAV